MSWLKVILFLSLCKLNSAWQPLDFPSSFLSDRPFNLKKELCCNGQFLANPDGNLNRECCGGKTYNPGMELCCEGNVHSGNSLDSSIFCCGNQTANYNKELCCHDFFFGVAIPVPLVGINRQYCCNRKPFDPLEEICCGGELVPRTGDQDVCCNDKLLKGEDEVCCKNATGEYPVRISDTDQRCCNGKLYNINKELCCMDQEIVEKPSGKHTCCGLQAYDPEKKLCCYTDEIEYVQPKSHPDDYYCCGNITDSGRNGICCIWEGEGKIHKDVYDGACCGLELYSISKPELNCCAGKSVYNMTSQVCCVNYKGKEVVSKVFDKPDYDYLCCGEEIFNPAIQECCGNIVLDKTEGNVSSCCFRG